MTIEIWLAFVLASTVLLVIPGPTILTVISYVLANGRRLLLPLVVAVALGDSTALLLSLAGLGALLATSAFWFAIVKGMGAIYLIILGISMLRSSKHSVNVTVAPVAIAGRRAFANTYLVTALNPKGMVFFLAFLPQFVSHPENAGGELLILGGTFVALAAVNTAAYAYFAGRMRESVGGKRMQGGFQRIGGALLTGAGFWALSLQRS